MTNKRRLVCNSKAARFLLRLDEQLGLFLDETLDGIQKPSVALKYGSEWRVVRREIEIAQLRSEERKRLHELRQRDILRVRRVADKYRIALTGKGMVELFRIKVVNADLLEDGSVCMVVFDIPEDHRKLRGQLRLFLIQAGFMCIQRSVWISPFNAAESLSQLFKVSNSSKWIRVFIANEIKE
ncbi:MAG: CRISPR-associated endonuclease Cas2 [Candidatus Uhrbacteria bacterium]|nr:CRISPR-associated endonuclease Cas2 [Candidatus Uhrbacteria bacterium]